MIALSAFADEIDQDLEIQIGELRKATIKHIEFRAAWGKNVLDLDDAEVECARALMDANMMRVSAVGSPIGKVKMDDDFEAHTARFRRALWVADKFETRYIRIFSFYGNDGKTPVGARAEVIRRLKLFAAMAADAGKVLCHENEANIYGDTPERCLEILEGVDSPGFRQVFDPANFIMEGLQPYDQCWAMLKPFVEYFHIKDASLVTRQMCPAGQGDGQIEETLRDALQSGFAGICTLEPHLKHAGQFAGQTGPGLFHVAADAFKCVVERAGGRWQPARAGVVGCGMIARFHLEAIAANPNAIAVGVTDKVGQLAESLGAKFGVPVFGSLDELITQAKPDFVCVCTPSGSHLETAEEAGRRGVHVLTEKPLEVTVERCDQAIAACKAGNAQLGVVFQSRYVPQLRRIKELLDAGRFGKIVVANAYTKWFRPQSYYDNGGWRGTWKMDGGGALMNQSIHYVDLLLWLAGDVTWVSAQMGALRHSIETEDHVAATLRFRSGAIGSLVASTAMYPGFDRVLEIVGTKGTIVIRDDFVPFCQIEGEDTPPEGVISQPPAATAAADPGAGLRGRHTPVIQDFVTAITEQRPIALDGSEGRRSVELICAVYASAKNSGQPVTL